jgi:hypothetical protein
LIQLQNSSGIIAQVTGDVSVTLSSSDRNVGTVDQNIIIPSSSSYAIAKFYTTYRSGTTTITATAADYTTGQASLTTVGPVPSKLVVYCIPSSLPADCQPYKAIQVQLQDSQGRPAKDPEGDIVVSLFSSEPEAGSPTATLAIPFGQTYATGTFLSTCVAKTTTITAQTSGYESGQSKITTYLIDRFVLGVSVTADPETIYFGNQTTIKAQVTYNGTSPTLGAKITFQSSINGGSFSATTEEGNGYYTTLFTAPNAKSNTMCTITANASKTGYNSAVGTVRITINPSFTGACTLQLQVAEENGNPITEAYATLWSQLAGGQTVTGFTDETGYLAFENLGEGNYTFKIVKDGYDTKVETIRLVAGQTRDVTVTLSSQASFPWLPITIAIVTIVIVAVLVALRLMGSARDDKALQQKAGRRANRL